MIHNTTADTTKPRTHDAADNANAQSTEDRENTSLEITF